MNTFRVGKDINKRDFAPTLEQQKTRSSIRPMRKKTWSRIWPLRKKPGAGSDPQKNWSRIRPSWKTGDRSDTQGQPEPDPTLKNNWIWPQRKTGAGSDPQEHTEPVPTLKKKYWARSDTQGNPKADPDPHKKGSRSDLQENLSQIRPFKHPEPDPTLKKKVPESTLKETGPRPSKKKNPDQNFKKIWARSNPPEQLEPDPTPKNNIRSQIRPSRTTGSDPQEKKRSLIRPSRKTEPGSNFFSTFWSHNFHSKKRFMAEPLDTPVNFEIWHYFILQKEFRKTYFFYYFRIKI